MDKKEILKSLLKLEQIRYKKETKELEKLKKKRGR